MHACFCEAVPLCVRKDSCHVGSKNRSFFEVVGIDLCRERSQGDPWISCGPFKAVCLNLNELDLQSGCPGTRIRQIVFKGRGASPVIELLLDGITSHAEVTGHAQLPST